MEVVLTKSQMMAKIAASQMPETFHHSVHGVFDVSRMRGVAMEQSKPALMAKCSEDLIEWLYENHNVDEKRITELTKAQIVLPCLTVEFADESDLLIDGVHRIIAGWVRYGFETFKFYRFQEREVIRPTPGMYIAQKPKWGKFDILRNGEIELF